MQAPKNPFVQIIQILTAVCSDTRNIRGQLDVVQVSAAEFLAWTYAMLEVFIENSGEMTNLETSGNCKFITKDKSFEQWNPHKLLE